MTNRSKPVAAGMPEMVTVITSLSVTWPEALGRHALIAAEEGCSAKENEVAVPEPPVRPAAEVGVR